MSDELIEAALMDYYGNRCDDFDVECLCCRAWAEYDGLREQGARAMQEAAAKAVIGYIHPDHERLPGEMFATAEVRSLNPSEIVKEIKP